MSFDSKNFSVMAYANGFTLWNYTTADTLESITASGYFNEIAPFARIGDMILTVAGAQSSVSYGGNSHCRRRCNSFRLYDGGQSLNRRHINSTRRERFV